MKFAILILSLFIATLNVNGQNDSTPKTGAFVIRKDFYDKMPNQNKIVCDFTKTLSTSQLVILDTIWTKFYKTSKKGIATAILDSGRISEKDFYSFAEAMYQSWTMINDRDAMYIIVSPELKRVRIFINDGIKKYLPEENIQQIISNIITTKFKNGHFFEGVKEGMEEIIRIIKRNGG